MLAVESAQRCGGDAACVEASLADMSEQCVDCITDSQGDGEGRPRRFVLLMLLLLLLLPMLLDATTTATLATTTASVFATRTPPPPP